VAGVLEAAALIVGAYLWGGIPSTYLFARYRKGVDLRDYGSGNVGASNLAVLAGYPVALTLGAFDTFGKGTLPVLLAGHVLGQDLYVQGAVGIAAVVGHNWSPYIRFTGGRGVSTAIGAEVGLLMWKEALIQVFLIAFVGRLVFKDAGMWTLIAVLVAPILAYFFRQPPELVYVASCLAAVLVLKRLTANWTLLRQDGVLRVMMRRLLWDRDVGRKEDWTMRRQPQDDNAEMERAGN
jgi:glycerol-3-phosphate acyltransferase PlsY